MQVWACAGGLGEDWPSAPYLGAQCHKEKYDISKSMDALYAGDSKEAARLEMHSQSHLCLKARPPFTRPDSGLSSAQTQLRRAPPGFPIGPGFLSQPRRPRNNLDPDPEYCTLSAYTGKRSAAKGEIDFPTAIPHVLELLPDLGVLHWELRKFLWVHCVQTTLESPFFGIKMPQTMLFNPNVPDLRLVWSKDYDRHHPFMIEARGAFFHSKTMFFQYTTRTKLRLSYITSLWLAWRARIFHAISPPRPALSDPNGFWLWLVQSSPACARMHAVLEQIALIATHNRVQSTSLLVKGTTTTQDVKCLAAFQ
ncbi:uncharacterized protein BDR25DRAFT_361787 [Lindgomyces ingoldianus]|uniref:Uncharacterized protein n=1 Tax=Lindgomyces ingoldianus TaxID=673940 RepID=A0ACB6QDR4_9PLEO|nr:uncharacterized protein BDR25DRAFT_361787 [Lindgomyces ingoldianus]KAF2464285.1 hypothetical protein BDR25DRAFT_361787 [Lindgomyces ingoldianus]